VKYNQRFLLNVVVSVLQIVIVGVSLFLFYRFTTEKLGKETFGLWSLILSFSALTNVGGLGISGGLVKFTAEFNVDKNYKAIRESLNISIVLVIIIFFFLSCVIYKLSWYFLPTILSADKFPDAYKLLPYTLIAFSINSVAALFWSVNDGLNKAYQKNLINIFSTLVFIILSYILISIYGILGIAYAQLAQSIFYVTGGIIFTYLNIPQYSIFSLAWNRNIISKILGYGLKLQGISICVLFYDPITKAILSKFAGLDYTTYFEIANRAVQQSRAILGVSVMNLIPKISELNYRSQDDDKQAIYLKCLRFSIFYCIVVYGFIGGIAPQISLFFLKEINSRFIFILIMLLLANFINSIILPAYIFATAEAKLKPMLISHVVIAVLNPVLSYIIAFIIPSYSILGWCIACTTGSLYIQYQYQKSIGINIHTVINQFSGIQIFICILTNGILFWIIEMYHMRHNYYWILALVLIPYVFFTALGVFLNTKTWRDLFELKKIFFKIEK
jgi:O-antigen/teichoic acid export membrane protein